MRQFPVLNRIYSYYLGQVALVGGQKQATDIDVCVLSSEVQSREAVGIRDMHVSSMRHEHARCVCVTHGSGQMKRRDA